MPIKILMSTAALLAFVLWRQRLLGTSPQWQESSFLSFAARRDSVNNLHGLEFELASMLSRG